MRPKEAGAVTLRVPLGVVLPTPTEARTASALASTSSAWVKNALPSSVSYTWRVVRCTRRTPRTLSSLRMWALATAGEVPSSWPARVMLWVEARRTKSRRWSRFIVCFQQNQ